ncbi:unnamed protein product [Medioppia subpectinata]|uniref:RUN domain-containing protein n=1 Tax=Medioppia subpectinata TaxID=1979941 RepID=A0A7R9KU44_9ACAR|nr:unnamed protein product [Medioppia subpectinata]CAG2109896.1 unnamed protein product [Medioppia subpectinata]
MMSLWRLASGSTVEEFAKDVYIKSNITIELNKTIQSLLKTLSELESKELSETELVVHLCDIFEAILLHGLKQKLTTRMSKVFTSPSQERNGYEMDFWTIVLILCHNEVSRNVCQLANISTDIGRCRAWLRSALNDGLILSYLEVLTADSSLLHGFYRSSAYIRDKEHTDIVKRLLIGLESYVFTLTIDSTSLDSWSETTLRLIGFSYVESEPQPVVTAIDAIDLLVDDNKTTKSEENIEFKFSSDKDTEDVISDNMSEPVFDIKSINSNEVIDEIVGELEMEGTKDSDSTGTTGTAETGNSLSRMSGWSSSPYKSDETLGMRDQSYDDILQSYSTQAVLSSTPDIRDLATTMELEKAMARPLYLTKGVAISTAREQSPTESTSSETDFEIIPKSIVLNNSDPETQKFLDQLMRLANEFGLDEQEYKCIACGRPIGMIYGKSRLCHFDGHQYCLDCHANDESIIPARVIHNWNFRKYPVAKRNKHLLISTETEPLFDIKILSPLLYSIVPEMKQTLDLRTQLFYLHAYLFTCQESIAIEMRKTVWPREHLFQHIHLYSVTDLFQVQNNLMSQTLAKVITFAKNHVLSCPLCTLKGYFCEICNSSQILYPFNTEATKRCEKCKTVFHLRCFNERYDKHSCPKCLRMEKRENKSLFSQSSGNNQSV